MRNSIEITPKTNPISFCVVIGSRNTIIDRVVAIITFSPTIGNTLLPSPPRDNARNVAKEPIDAHIPPITAKLTNLGDVVKGWVCIMWIIAITII